MKRKPPHFKSEAEERTFWQKKDSMEYIDWKQATPVSFSNLKPSTKTISLRLPENLLNEIKRLAHKRDVPYQSLLKLWLSESAARQRNS